jgi:T-complex protein 1 subunit gamma
LAGALPFIERSIHPITIIAAYKQALEDALLYMKEISVPVDTSDKQEMMKIIKSCIGTKLVSQWSDLMCGLAYDAVKTVAADMDGKKEIDIKRYARVEKVHFFFF